MKIQNKVFMIMMMVVPALNAMYSHHKAPLLGHTVAHPERSRDGKWMSLREVIKQLTPPEKILWPWILKKIQELNIEIAINPIARGEKKYVAGFIEEPCGIIHGAFGATFKIGQDKNLFISLDYLYEPTRVYVGFGLAPAEAFEEFKKEFNWDGKLS